MPLIDVFLPKQYKNQKILFEQQLDAWRQATEQAFATLHLNLTQLRKDCFLSNYDYTNTGNNSLSQSLQQQINLLSSGGIPLSGTTSDTWTINTDGFSSTLSTSGLTDFRTFTFPNSSGQLTVNDATQTLTNKTLTAPAITGTVSGGATYSSVTLTTPTIASFTNATHSHQNAAGGGTLSAAAITTNVTGSGNIVKATSPTISSPTFSGTITMSASPTISGSFTVIGTPTFQGNVNVQEGDRIFLNTALTSGIHQIGTTQTNFEEGGSVVLTILNTTAIFPGTSNGTIDLGAASSQWQDIYLAGNLVFGNLATLTVTAGTSLDIIAPGGDGYSFSGSAFTSPNNIILTNASDVSVNATQKYIMDGSGGDTYISKPGAFVGITVDGDLVFELTAAGISNDFTSLLLWVDRAGTESLSRVLVGAVDTAGAGFRALCISN